MVRTETSCSDCVSTNVCQYKSDRILLHTDLLDSLSHQPPIVFIYTVCKEWKGGTEETSIIKDQ